MKHEEFARTIAQARIEPVYVIFGREDLLVSRSLEAIKQKILGPDRSGAAWSELEGDEVVTDPAKVFNLLRTRDLFSAMGRHLVVMYNAGRFAATHREALKSFRASAPAAGSLVLLVPGPEDRRGKPPSSLERIGLTVDCRPPFENEVRVLVHRIAGQFGKTLSPDAAAFLLETAGSSLGQLRQQIESLAMLLGDRSEITEEDIQQLVGTDFQRDVWSLLNALSGERGGQALRVLDRLFRQDAAEKIGPQVIGALNYELRQIARAKELLDAGEPPSRVKAELTGPTAVRQQRLRAARGSSWPELGLRIKALAEADLKCKTSALPPQAALEALVLRWAAPGRSPGGAP